MTKEALQMISKQEDERFGEVERDGATVRAMKPNETICKRHVQVDQQDNVCRTDLISLATQADVRELEAFINGLFISRSTANMFIRQKCEKHCFA